MRLLVVLALAVLVSGCGAAKKPAAPPAGGAMEARLKAHGYAVTEIPRAAHQPYERAFSVDHIDWTSARAFSVSVFIFESKANAQGHSEHTAALVGRFPQTNKSKLVGSYLFVATADTGGALCTMVNGTPSCPSTPGIRIADFDRVIAVARG